MNDPKSSGPKTWQRRVSYGQNIHHECRLTPTKQPTSPNVMKWAESFDYPGFVDYVVATGLTAGADRRGILRSLVPTNSIKAFRPASPKRNSANRTIRV